MANTYDLVYFGEIIPGWDTAQAREALAATLRLDAEQSARVFSGQRIVLKRALAANEAERYVRHLEGMGVRARVEPPLASLILGASPPPPRPVAPPATVAPAAPSSAAVPEGAKAEAASEAVTPAAAAAASAIAAKPIAHEESESLPSDEAEPAAWLGWRLQGRLGRLSYLWAQLTLFGVSMLATGLWFAGHWAPAVAIGLASTLLSLRLIALRCHDIGWTGWWALLALVPLVGVVFLLVIHFVPGTENSYGPRPRQGKAVGAAVALATLLVAGYYMTTQLGALVMQLAAVEAARSGGAASQKAPDVAPKDAPITVTMYGNTACKRCEAARDKLIRLGINVIYIKLDGGLPEAQRADILAKIEAAGIPTASMELPIVQVDGAYLQNPPPEILARTLVNSDR